MISQNQNTSEELLESSGTIFGAIDFWGVLLRRKWLLFIGLLVGLGLGFLYYQQATPKYESVAQIHVTSKGSSRIYQSRDMSGGYDAYMSGGNVANNVLPTHAVLIRSPLIVDRAIHNRKLDQLDSFAGMDDPRGAIMQGLSVIKGSGTKEGAEANVLTLTFRSLNSKDCQEVLAAVVATYEDYLGETYQNVSQTTVELISKAKDDLQQQLLQKEARYQEFRRNAPLMWRSDTGANVYAVRLNAIEDARAKAVVRRVDTLARANAIETALHDGASRQALELMTKRLARNVMEAGALQSTSRDWQSELLPLHVQEKMLMQLYGPEHPRVKALQEELQMRINFYRSREEEKEKIQPIDDYLDIYVASLKQEVRETKFQEDALTELFDKDHNQAKKLELYEVQDEQLQADIERTKELFRSVVSRLQEINLIKDYGGYEIQVITQPGQGGQVEPSLPTSLSVGGLVGLMLGFGLALLIDLADKSFRSADEIRQQLGLPVVAHIPVLDIERGKVGPGQVDPAIITFHNPKSREAEAYRRVRTSLYFSTHGQNNKVIQVTSPDPSDGKTTLATNMAASIAQSGKRVLIIDADFRRPKIHRALGLTNDVGITQVITAEQEIADVIIPCAIPNLDVMCCGPRPHNPAELLSSPRFKETLETVRSHYDFVVVDTPPVLAVTDPMAVAPCVDGVILTIRLSKSGRPSATRSIEQLREVGARIIGVVVNGVGGASRYGYRYGAKGYRSSYYYYGSRYYQYSEDYTYGKQYGSYYDVPGGKKRQASGEQKQNGSGKPTG